MSFTIRNIVLTRQNNMSKLIIAEQAVNSKVIKFITEKGYDLALEDDVLKWIECLGLNREEQMVEQEENGCYRSQFVETQTASEYLDENWEKVTNRFYNQVILKG